MDLLKDFPMTFMWPQFLWLLLHPAHSPGVLPTHCGDATDDPELAPIALVREAVAVPQDGPLAMLSNAFGFGGSNVSLILGRV